MVIQNPSSDHDRRIKPDDETAERFLDAIVPVLLELQVFDSVRFERGISDPGAHLLEHNLQDLGGVLDQVDQRAPIFFTLIVEDVALHERVEERNCFPGAGQEPD